LSVVSELRLAVEVPRWAGRFYLRHWAVVIGLSLIASVQRLVVVNWGDVVPSGVAFASEVVVVAARVLLVVVIWRLATRGERLRWANARDFATRHWPSLVWQGVLLAAATAVFDFGAEQVVGGLLPESARQTYLAVLLFVKNPTVIAFTFVWLVGLVRQVAVSRPVPVG
jgi:di/tricarboxylate transporter